MPKLKTSANFVATRAGNPALDSSASFRQVCHGHNNRISQMLQCARVCVCVSSQCLMLIVTGIGVTCSIIFHVGLKEPPSEDITDQHSCSHIITWYQWLREPQFYLVRSL